MLVTLSQFDWLAGVPKSKRKIAFEKLRFRRLDHPIIQIHFKILTAVCPCHTMVAKQLQHDTARYSSAIREKNMSHAEKAAEHHSHAAKHHEHAAKHHHEAAKYHTSGDHEKAGHHAHLAHAHHTHAEHHHEEAAKTHAEHHS
jgi:hypothetical protein